ncbi:hypothetical protein J6590_069832 [Homalodisca vitripennis]|nr:hypothetical protein J6590_069832 [Homalodisca vitripennis]
MPLAISAEFEDIFSATTSKEKEKNSPRDSRPTQIQAQISHDIRAVPLSARTPHVSLKGAGGVILAQAHRRPTLTSTASPLDANNTMCKQNKGSRNGGRGRFCKVPQANHPRDNHLSISQRDMAINIPFTTALCAGLQFHDFSCIFGQTARHLNSPSTVLVEIQMRCSSHTLSNMKTATAKTGTEQPYRQGPASHIAQGVVPCIN